MFYIGQAIKLLCFPKLQWVTGDSSIHKEKSIYPKDTGFRLGAILVTVYKFMLHL